MSERNVAPCSHVTFPHLSHMKRFIPLTLAVVACNAGAPTEHYGFITTLGRDTIAVERISRNGNELSSDEVDRFPRVKERHTDIDLNDDGSIKRLVMDVHVPSEVEAKRDQHIEASVTRGRVEITKRDATGTFKRSFDSGAAMVMAHVPQMYSLYELYFAAAMSKPAAKPGDTVRFRQFYIDREFDNFPLHRASVMLRDSGRAEIRHDWLSGIGEAVLDSAHHMLRYNGSRTTYDVRVTRVSTPPDLRAIGAAFAEHEAKNGPVKQLSVRDTTRATIGTATFMIDYGRPLARGRVLLGNVIRYGSVWRTGANAATQFSTSAHIKIGTLDVPAGMYTLWSVPREDGSADLIVNKETGQWGTAYNGALNLGRTPLKTEIVPTSVEEFKISIVPVDAKRGTLVLEWGTFRWSAPIVLL